jgi:hypothetical protein
VNASAHVSYVEHRADDSGHARTSQKDDPYRNLLSLMKLHLFTNVTVVDNVIKFVSDKSSSTEPKLEKHKVDDVVTVDKKHSNNDIQRSEKDSSLRMSFFRFAVLNRGLPAKLL